MTTFAAQVKAVARLELRRTLSWRSLWLPLIAGMPLVVLVAHIVEDHRHGGEEELLVLNALLQFYYLRSAVVFGCLGLSMRLLRGEVAERTLHYAFLAPVRREALVLGKFLAATAVAMAVFGSAVVAATLLIHGHFPAGRALFLHGPALAHLAQYLLVTALACLGYGAVFLAFGLVFRNPIVPAVVLVFWEALNAALPPWLKHLSVSFYLKPLMPVELPVGGVLRLFTVVAEPTPAWLAASGLLVVTAALLAFSCWRVRRLEVSYSTD